MSDKPFSSKNSPGAVEQNDELVNGQAIIPDIEPTSDFMFKKIFGTHEDLLVSFLNSMLSQQDQVHEVTIVDSTSLKDWKHGKTSILDIKAKGENGKFYHIEIQVESERDYESRCLYYWSRIYTDQIQADEGYETLTKTISIHILDFVPNFFKKRDAYHDTYGVLSLNDHVRYMDHFEMHFVLLKKFSSQNDPDIYSKVKNKLDEWIVF